MLPLAERVLLGDSDGHQRAALGNTLIAPGGTFCRHGIVHGGQYDYHRRWSPRGMEPLDTLSLDRSIARAAHRARQYLRRLHASPDLAAEDCWYASDRHVTTRTTFASISELPASDPLLEGLRRWVYRLAITRIAEPFLVRVASARNARELRFETPETGVFSVRGVIERVLSERSPDKREAWIHALEGARHATKAIRGFERSLAEAKREIESRLSESPAASALWLPYPYDGVADLAQTVLKLTRDLASHTFPAQGSLGGVIGLLMANDVPGVWPAQPTARWLVDLFGGTPLLEGLDLDLGPLPRSIGASSFARALCRFGAACARAAAPREAPFVLAHDATLMHPYRRGALFASLLADPVFLRTRLGFSRDASRAVARSLAITFVGAARLEAARALVDFATAPASDIQGILEEAFCVPYHRALAGLLPSPCPSAPIRLASMLLASTDRDELVHQYDEDWFRNPRGLSHLRELDAVVPALHLDPTVIAGSAAGWAKWLTDLTG